MSRPEFEHQHFPEETETSSLERQFNNPERLRTDGGNVSIHDVVPLNLKTKVPVFFAQGHVTFAKEYEANIIALAECGRRVLAVDAPHGIDAEPVKGHAQILLRKAAGLVKALEQKGIKKADAVGHSQGTLTILTAAYLHPEKFRNLVLVEPLGLIGKDSVAKMYLRHFADVAASIARPHFLRKDEKRRKVSLKDQAKFQWREINKRNVQFTRDAERAMIEANMATILDDLRRLGIKITIIHSADSKIVPGEKLRKTVKTHPVDYYRTIPGTHMGIRHYPTTYTKATDHYLTKMADEPL